MRSAPITSASCNSSVGLPKQANPALRVEAPEGIIPLSNISIFNPGSLSFKSCAHQRPHKPAPTIIMSRSAKKLSCSQMDICMGESYDIREVHKKAYTTIVLCTPPTYLRFLLDNYINPFLYFTYS